MIQNVSRKKATNVRVSHYFLPLFREAGQKYRHRLEAETGISSYEWEELLDPILVEKW